ncbi:MAG: hypothetical protein GX621_08490, partial [Pirellulaceae bacterium]|nr:hypothetical protein [Pirellulaceae bacterium]
ASGRWVQRFLVGLIAVFIVAAVYAIDMANEAQSTSHKTQVTLQSHLAAEAETSRYLKERLDEIRADLREQRKLLDSLMREGRGGMGK